VEKKQWKTEKEHRALNSIEKKKEKQTRRALR
jgi:hypothetical protein